MIANHSRWPEFYTALPGPRRPVKPNLAPPRPGGAQQGLAGPGSMDHDSEKVPQSGTAEVWSEKGDFDAHGLTRCCAPIPTTTHPSGPAALDLSH